MTVWQTQAISPRPFGDFFRQLRARISPTLAAHLANRLAASGFVLPHHITWICLGRPHPLATKASRNLTHRSGGYFVGSRTLGEESYAAPRDNVIFEMGLFMESKGRERVSVVREEGAKIPADIGGGIYLSLKDRNDIAPIQMVGSSVGARC